MDLEDYMNGILSLQGTTIKGNNEQIFQHISEQIKKISDIEITKNLNLTDADKTNSLTLREEAYEEFQKVLSPSKKESKISKKVLNEHITALQKLAADNINNKNAKKFKDLVRKIEKKYEILKKDQTYKHSIKIDTFKDGKKLKKTKTAAQLINYINEAYQYVKYGGTANKIGEIGELFGLMATYMYANKVEKIDENIINELKAVKDKKGTSLIWLGQESSRKLYHEGPTFQGSFIDPNSGVKYAAHDNSTQDKVDFQIVFPDEGNITFSMKNYSNP